MTPPGGIAVAGYRDPSAQAAKASAEPEAAEASAEPEAMQVDIGASSAPAAEEVSWYYQDATTKQPAGPWTVSQLTARWRRNSIDGCTPVWRNGLQGGWQPLSNVTELKDAFQQAAAASDDDDEDVSRPAKRRKRTPMDDLPLTHTYTSDAGLLYVYDTVDEDWKVSDVYESLLAEESASSTTSTPSATNDVPDAVQKDANGLDVEEEMRKLLGETESMGDSLRVSMKQPGKGKGKGAAKGAVEGDASSGGAAGSADTPQALAEPVDAETEAKRQRKREYRERKKLKRQAGLFVKAQENPNVYVSGLPADVTHKELDDVFKRAGVLKVDVSDEMGGSKIRIYGDDETGCKGDALVTYAHAASVELAIKFLHEYEIRPKCKICVQQADFEDVEGKSAKFSKDELKALAATKKGDRAKYLAAKSATKEAVSWSGEMDDGSGRRIIVLRHMFSPDEAIAEGTTEVEFYKELGEEVTEECAKIGSVLRVTPMERHKQGIVCVKFRTSAEAEECIRVMDGRFFGGRNVEASFYDGVTNFKVFGVQRSGSSETAAAAPQAVNSKSAAEAEQPVAAVDPESKAVGAVDAPVAADAADEVPATSGEGASGPAAGQSWEDWLNNQDSDSSDDEFKVKCEE